MLRFVTNAVVILVTIGLTMFVYFVVARTRRATTRYIAYGLAAAAVVYALVGRRWGMSHFNVHFLIWRPIPWLTLIWVIVWAIVAVVLGAIGNLEFRTRLLRLGLAARVVSAFALLIAVVGPVEDFRLHLDWWALFLLGLFVLLAAAALAFGSRIVAWLAIAAAVVVVAFPLLGMLARPSTEVYAKPPPVTSSPTPTPSPIPTAQVTSTPSPTPTPTPTPTPSPSADVNHSTGNDPLPTCNVGTCYGPVFQ